ncbi:OLC1v1005945C1 [Oldenlandia corymbosa var. corymbosa]|uniref:OLC1v1005945C1 n=1 Tax=Oldenlandia corymbosa var. corymbosa TaxID=529605 RepID=A0AAV1DH35_OLDCO|nr:OLC1v1005945C1 [Oldenlandia corymbosa var. corymbosa]
MEKMQVKIQETAVIYPSSAPFTDDHVLQLSHLDTDRNLQVTFRYLRVYLNSDDHENKPNSTPFQVITSALSAALVRYYYFAGSLRRRSSSDDNRLELYCEAGKGVPVIRAEVDFPLSSVNYLDDDPDEEFVEGLVPDPTLDEVMAHPMTLQLTMFSCGGFVLGAALHHSLCDGLGATLFFNAMAELARGANQIPVEPVWDRMKLLGTRNPPRIEFPIQEFLSLDRDFPPYSEKTGRVVRVFFPVKDDWLDRLKGILFDQSSLKFTAFEALGAFIWRARVKASKIPSNETVKFAYSINVRKIVKPPLPAGYWGNGCVPMYVVATAGDVVEQPIWKTAELIKKSKYNVSDEYVRSFIDFQELNYDKGITAGTNISGFTDWRHLGHSTVDFGWGGPVTVFPLSRNLLGSVEPCFFLPYSSVNQGPKDGFKLSVYLQEHAVGGFKEEMNRLKFLERACL